MERSADGTRVDTGGMHFELGDDCVLRHLRAGNKTIVAENTAPLLSAWIFESRDYDGRRDAASGAAIRGKWLPDKHVCSMEGGLFRAEYTGRIDFGSGDALECTVRLGASDGSALLRTTVGVSPIGSFFNRFIRGVSLHVPLVLDRRKRVRQAGDRGVRWNTRHWYQFCVGTRGELMAEPEHNIWRLFATDQNTARDFHIWRAESPATCALTMQRGIRAPGWMAAHDRDGGLVFGYRGFAERAPKSLRVDAENGGAAEICLWHEGLPALDVRAPDAAAVFGEPHVCGWQFFEGQFDETQPAPELEQALRLTCADSPSANKPFEVLPSDAPAADSEAPLVSGGVPLPRGALKDASNVRLRRDGSDIPLQSRALGYWPDGYIKWLLLTFPADGGETDGADGEGEALSFDLTRRDGSRRGYRLDYGGDARSGKPRVRLEAEMKEANTVSIDTGPLRLTIRPGERWLASAVFQGREMLADGGARSFVDFLRVSDPYKCMTTHAQGEPDDGPFAAETAELEEAGPLRAVVRIEGKTTSREPARVIIRIEAYAGRSTVRIFHSVEFLHQDPRAAFVRRMGIELPLTPMEDIRVSVGGETGASPAASCASAGLIHHSHLGYRAWSRREGERFMRTDEIKNRSRGWINLRGGSGGIALMLRNMWQQFPNELIADTVEPRLTAGLWPESAPVMDVRRYSNYPHPSQGECTPPGFSNWVAERYYGHDPFVGVSKTHELLLYFHGSDADEANIDAIAADFNRPPLVYCGGDWYVRTGVILPQSSPSSADFPLMHANLDHYARFWLHHQKLWGWYGIWDYGDIIHMYKFGLGTIVPDDKLVELIEHGEWRTAADIKTGIDATEWKVRDYAPDNEWAFDNGRWGWTNTEGLPGMFMQNQYMRTGDREIFFFAEAMARHSRDVDMRHAGRFFGRGTRHGVQHWSDGDHEERQTTHSEFRYVYALTGDNRCRDVARRLFDGFYSKRDLRQHADHSGRLQGLLAWWEMSGSRDVAAMIAKYVPAFILPDGIVESPEVCFSDMTCLSRDPGDINAGNMFFWTFGAAHGLLEYYYLIAGDTECAALADRLRNALVRSAEHALDGSLPRNLLKAVAFAARHADDPAPFKERLRQEVKDEPFFTRVVPHDPEQYSGARGYIRGNVSGSLFIMNAIVYLLSALDGEPAVAYNENQEFHNGGDGPFHASELSWQSEYDRPELREYLQIRYPQP